MSDRTPTPTGPASSTRLVDPSRRADAATPRPPRLILVDEPPDPEPSAPGLSDGAHDRPDPDRCARPPKRRTEPVGRCRRRRTRPARRRGRPPARCGRSRGPSAPPPGTERAGAPGAWKQFVVGALVGALVGGATAGGVYRRDQRRQRDPHRRRAPSPSNAAREHLRDRRGAATSRASSRRSSPRSSRSAPAARSPATRARAAAPAPASSSPPTA